MNVELKNVKLAGGEETPRFEASVYIDGKRRGTVANGGTGGPCTYSDREAERELCEYGKSLGPVVCEDMRDPHDPSKPFQYDRDADSVVFDLLDRYEVDKALKRDLNGKILFRIAGENEVRQISRQKFPEDRVRAHITEKFGVGATILNDLDFEEVRRHYSECGLI